MAIIQKNLIHSSKKFNYHSETKTFTAEASMLGRIYDRLYNDACDVGFWMRSEKTGNDVCFYLVNEIRDAENELNGWEFLPAPESIRKFPHVAEFKVTVFND